MMTVRLALAGALLLPALTACDGGSSSREPAPDNSPEARTAASEASRPDAPESIVREAVLAETAPAEEPAVEPIEITLNFSDADAKLPEAAIAALQDMLQQPIMAADFCITVSGHTDSRGSDRQNLEVSQERAEAVATYLSEHGIAQDRISVIALGERIAIAPNARPDGGDYPEGRARNRRVEVDVLPAGGSSCGRKDPAAQANTRAEPMPR